MSGRGPIGTATGREGLTTGGPRGGSRDGRPTGGRGRGTIIVPFRPFDPGGPPTDQDQPPYVRPAPLRRVHREQREIEWNQSAAGQFIPIVLGTRAVGCQYFYVKSSGMTSLWLVAGVCEGPIKEMRPRIGTSAMVKDPRFQPTDPSWKYPWIANGVKLWVYDGTQTSINDGPEGGLYQLHQFDSTQTKSYGASGGKGGLAFVVIKLTYSTDGLNSVPSFVFDVDGSLVWNPHLSTWQWSDNPALAIREVLTNKTWGMGNDYTSLDEPSFIAAMNACDYTLSNGQKRYRINAAITQQVNPTDLLNTLRAHCSGILTFQGGRYSLTIDQKFTGTPRRFSETDYEDGGTKPANVVPENTVVSRKERSGMYNQVRANFSDAANRWQPSNKTVQTAAVTAGTELPRLGEFWFDWCPTQDQNTRLAVHQLNRSQDDVTIQFEASRQALAVTPWDVIIYNGSGFAWQEFRVRKVRLLENENIEIYAEEYHDESYNDTVNDEDSPVASDLPDPSAIPPDPPEYFWSPQQIVGPDGVVMLKIRLDWIPADGRNDDYPGTPYYRGTVIYVNDGLTVRNLGEFAQGPVYIENPRLGVVHKVKFQTVTIWGKYSAGLSELTFTPSLVPVLDVTDLTAPHANVTERGLVYWTNPDMTYVDHFEIFDTFGQPIESRTGPLIASIPAQQAPTSTTPLDLSYFIHGDGYISAAEFDITVKVVNTAGTSSPGARGANGYLWRIEASGETSYDVGKDPRQAASDGSNIWVTNFGGNTIFKIGSDPTQDPGITVGTKPYGIWYDGAYMWTANYGGSPNVAKVNLTTGQVVWQSPSDAQMATATGIIGAKFMDRSVPPVSRFDIWTTTWVYPSQTPSSRICRIDGNNPGVASHHLTPAGGVFGGGPMLIVKRYPQRGGSSLSIPPESVKLYASFRSGDKLQVIDLMVPVADLSTEAAFQSLELGAVVVEDQVIRNTGPWGMCDDGTYIWVACYSSGTVVKIEPETGIVAATVPLGGATPVDCAFDGTSVWVSDGLGRQLIRINPNTNKVVSTVPLGSYPRMLLWDGSDIWIPSTSTDLFQTVPISVYNPPKAGGTDGGTSNSINLQINGANLSPFPG